MRVARSRYSGDWYPEWKVRNCHSRWLTGKKNLYRRGNGDEFAGRYESRILFKRGYWMPEFKSTDLLFYSQTERRKIRPSNWWEARSQLPALLAYRQAGIILTRRFLVCSCFSCEGSAWRSWKTINWQTESTGTGRFGNGWKLQDWKLSRSRYRGVCHNLAKDGLRRSLHWQRRGIEWTCWSTCLRRIYGKQPMRITIIMLARRWSSPPYIDDIVLVSPSGKEMRRELDLIDVWFDSGSMRLCAVALSIRNEEVFQNNFPAGIYREGVIRPARLVLHLHAIGVMCLIR